MKKKFLKAFSLVEVSIVLLIIGIIAAAITEGSKMINRAKLTNARLITKTSGIDQIPNLIAWYETTLIGSVVGANSYNSKEPENNDLISGWKDLNPSETKYNLLQSNSTLQPRYVIDAIKNLPAIKFDGTNDIFTISDVNMFGRTAGYSIFFVATTPPNLTTSAAYNIFRTEQGITAGFASTASSTGFTCSRLISTYGTWLGSWLPINAPVILNGIPTICSSVYNGSSLAGYTNGTADTPSSVSGNVVIPSGIAIGANPGNIEYFNNYLGELIIFNYALKQNERKVVEAYLGKKWSIRVN